MNHEKHLHNVKNLGYLVAFLVAAYFFYVFKTHQDVIMNSNSFNMYYLLVVLGAVFLVSFVYLVSKSTSPKAHKSSSKKRSRK